MTEDDPSENYTDEVLRWLEEEARFDVTVLRMRSAVKSRRSLTRREMAAIVDCLIEYRERFLGLKMKELGI